MPQAFRWNAVRSDESRISRGEALAKYAELGK